jgi:hypothetical protein
MFAEPLVHVLKLGKLGLQLLDASRNQGVGRNLYRESILTRLGNVQNRWPRREMLSRAKSMQALALG